MTAKGTTSMDRFLVSQSLASDWRSAADACIAGLGALPSSANLGFVYASDHFGQSMPLLLTHLRESTGVEHWVGTVGTGVCATGIEYHEEPALALMVGAFPQDSFRVFGPLRHEAEPHDAAHLGWSRRVSARFGVVHGDPRNPRISGLLEALAGSLDGGFLVGGLTSSRSAYAQVADEVSEGGLSGVLFAQQVDVATALTQSCAPYGESYEITDCDRNVIATLDGRPALEVFYEAIGDILARDLDRAARYIGAALPVPGSDTGDYLVRNIVGVDPENHLLAIGEMLEQGGRIRFCRRDPANAERDMRRMLGRLRDRLPRPPRGGVYFSCLGRGRHMFGEDSLEMRVIREELGDVPVVGFFCNGEISHDRLYGYTGVLALFL